MAKTDYPSVEAYLAKQPLQARRVLKQVRSIIRHALPKAEEVISYQIPAYKVDGALVIYFAGWKAHYSLYPASEFITERLKTKLEPYKISKGTIRFPLSEPVPSQLVTRIVKLRAQEIAARLKAKRTAIKSK